MSFETKIVGYQAATLNAANGYDPLSYALSLRELKAEEWVEKYASGTLRKNKRIGMRWRSQYREERVAWEFGYPFTMRFPTRLTFSDAITAGDCSAVTEAGWHIDRYIEKSLFPEDVWTVKYIKADSSEGKNCHGPTEGIGIICKQTSAAWVPKKMIVYAIVAEYCPIGERFTRVRSI